MRTLRLHVITCAMLAGLAGCANPDVEQQLAQAAVAFAKVSNDPQIQRGAPKDVARAGDSLGRAQRFAEFWGGAENAQHYAYLSLSYSEIARQHGALLEHQQRVMQLEMERERLLGMVRDARLLSAQQQGRWGEDQMISMAATETDRGLVMTLGDVLFRAGSDELGREANRTLLKLAHFLELNPQRRVRIEGYTDSRGGAEENLALSRARAQAVADVLIDLGIAPQRIQVRGYGEGFPIAENASSRGRAQNRRVEILFSDAQGMLGADR